MLTVPQSMESVIFLTKVFQPLIDLIIFIGSACLALSMVYCSFTDWQGNQVFTTIKTLTKLEFPAVTICGGGKHMELVKKVLYNNFNIWNQKRSTTNESFKEDFAQYMQETFQIDYEGFNILDILNMVVANSEESSNSQIIKQNEVACSDISERESNNHSCQTGKSKY